MSKKLLVAGVMLALVATFAVAGVSVAGAQSMTLCQTVSALVAAGVIAPDKVAAANAAAGCSAAAPVASYTFTRNLTVGSTGADVTALQTKLGVSPATGYFGAITKAAVVAFQTANGLPATGFVGPMTLAKLNAGVTTTTTTTTTNTTNTTSTTCPAGMTCTPVVACPAGFTCTSNTTGMTSGTEGTLTVSQSNAGLASSIYEGDSKVGVLGLKLEAKNSDISVQRINVDLGTSTTVYNKVFNKIYVMDGNTVLASADLNSNTVTKDSATPAEYYITLTGINAVVAKNASKTLVIALDVNGSVDTTYRSPRTYTIGLYGSDPIRGTDGAGLDEYASTNSVNRSVSVSSSLSDSSTLKTSLDSSSPVAATVIAADGANQNEADKVTTLVFNVKATKSDITITDLTATTTGTAVTAGEIATAYLYDGATELDNSSVSASGVSTFNNLTIDVAKDSTKTLTIKVDVRNASSSALTVTSMVDGGADGITAENANGDNVANQSGSATGNQLQVQSAGAVYTLVGTPTLTKTAIGNTASSSYLASFTFDIAASGADVNVASTSAFVVGIYSNTGALLASSSVGYDKPTSGIVTESDGSYTIADGSSARFNPQFSFTAPAGVYTAGTIVSARIISANTSLGTVTYISDTFRTGSQAL